MKKIGYVALGSLLLAIVLFISGTMIGGFSELETLYDKGDFTISLPITKTMDVTKEFTDIKNLEIQAEAGTVELIEYEGSTIKVEAKNVSKKIKLYQEQNTLIVKDSFRFWHLINVTDITTRIKIYIPNSYEFNKVELEVDAGSFKAENIIASYTKVDVDAGDARINLLNSYRSEFNCDAGDIDATMVGSESDYSYEVDSDVGDISIGSYRSDGLSDEYSHSGGQRKIEADCNVGSIRIKMEV
ncbi:DUF4097 family beta strand repeat-containing protein [Thomasclavelia ramosa]|uniref:DUF4097 family beta strand repeat-containing protein n=1 Tax=Thomasclavelia ramosa TaxID=1547 RepID=UPI000E48974A|nr:DUF4097 family beta strand repeat-containing protein [Thomasclavelia ramosa]RHB94329.1 hypothetical protein DW864_15975 [Thomasclavelia ramosa]